MIVTLNEGEQRIVKFLGKQRASSNRTAGVVDQQRSNRITGEDGDIDGVGAEIAFARLFNLYPDLSIGPRQGGYDVSIMGITVDVKTTRYPNGRLIAMLNKKLEDAQFYGLMVGEFPTYEFKGLCPAEQLITAKRIIDLGHGQTYAVEQSDPNILTADDIFGADGY